MGEALAERKREEGEQDTEDDDVPTGGLADFDGFDVALEGPASEGAEAAELGSAEVSAGVGEGGLAELPPDLAIQLDQFADLTAEGKVVGVADGREFDRNEKAIAVAGEERVDGGKGIWFCGLDQFGEGGERRERLGGTQRLGEGIDFTGEVLARGFGGGSAGVVWEQDHGWTRTDRGGA